MAGFIRLSRSFFNNKMWQAARKFSECEAWLDLIQSARFEASPITSLIGSCEVTWDRGQYPASVRFLSKKWGQSESWVRKFLSKLSREKMIAIENTQGVSVITLVNYDKYNPMENNLRKNTPIDTPSDTPNNLNVNQLQELLTQVLTQVLTQCTKTQDAQDISNNLNISELNDVVNENNLRKNTHNKLIDNMLNQNCTQTQHTYDTNNKKEEEILTTKKKDNNKLLSKKETLLLSSKSENDEYSRFCKWVLINAPNCMSERYSIKPLSEEEYMKLRKHITGTELTEYILSVENNAEYLKKYKSMYLTFLKWIKNDGKWKGG